MPAPPTYPVCYARVQERDFRQAKLFGINIIIDANDLVEGSTFYQRHGFFEESIALMESGIGLERVHMGIFTELGFLYAKYKNEWPMEHLELVQGRAAAGAPDAAPTRINMPRLIRMCKEYHHWKELVFPYIQSAEYDNAAMVMVNHSPVAWEHVP
ncbi:hypothetical protein WJX72_006813 [[Myrmecia] bisecta]|uniref:Uncharacterized protein n=1 Tax=[Myrmecia] bisecta TaxID=41462 RepID=A0AAW1P8R6_9CHLO